MNADELAAMTPEERAEELQQIIYAEIDGDPNYTVEHGYFAALRDADRRAAIMECVRWLIYKGRQGRLAGQMKHALLDSRQEEGS